MPRLFTALEIPADIVAQLVTLQCGLPSARWIEPQNFHITVRFLGDIATTTTKELTNALKGVRMTSFTLQLGELGVFGNKKPHALFASVEKNPELLKLQVAHEKICRSLDLEPERRRFRPHVTLARTKQVEPINVVNYLSCCAGFRSPLFEVTRFVLLSSRKSTGGGPYVVEEIYPMRGAHHADAKNTESGTNFYRA